MNEESNSGIGIVTGTSSSVGFPDINASRARVKASFDGVRGFIGVGGNPIYPLDVGEDTGWFAINNLNEYCYSGTGSYLAYWYQY